MSNRTLPPSTIRRQSPQRSDDLPVDVKVYLREVAYVAREAATTTNPVVARLGLQLLARQARTLDAPARSCCQ